MGRRKTLKKSVARFLESGSVVDEGVVGAGVYYLVQKARDDAGEEFAGAVYLEVADGMEYGAERKVWLVFRDKQEFWRVWDQLLNSADFEDRLYY